MVHSQIKLDAAEELTKEISVAEVLRQISVRRPYFAFNEMSWAPGGYLCAPITREQPMGCECGVMAAAEIGRHLAILGSCAASMQNAKPGQHYYLAWDAHLRHLCDLDEELSCSDLMGQAKARLVDKRTACAETHLIHKPSGRKLHRLEIEYLVLNKKTFERSFSSRRTETPEANWNPYAKDALEMADIVVLDHLLSANLSTLEPQACAGHFPDFPALPVAILAKILISLAGELFAHIVGVENAPYKVVEAVVKSKNLAFTDDKVQLIIRHQCDEDKNGNYVFRCLAVTEQGAVAKRGTGNEQGADHLRQDPYGDLTITLQHSD